VESPNWVLQVKEDRAKVVKPLLDYVVDPNIEDSAGKTYLFYAADQGNGRIARLPLSRQIHLFMTTTVILQ
jgi:ankyrin repeat protein